MTPDPRTPVLVGTGLATQRSDDPAAADEAVALMLRAVEDAGDEAGDGRLLPRVQQVWVPQGTWGYADPGRILADRIGAPDATTVLTRLGILQSALIAGACGAISRGDLDVALVVGGEAKHRALMASKAGVDAAETVQTGVEPHRVVATDDVGVADLEAARGAVQPVGMFALIENALRAHNAWSPLAHRTRLGALWAAMGRVAAENPHAWDRSRPGADEIAMPTASNRMLATPYTKLLCSQWNVDQASALLFCSLETARSLGLNEDGWIFPAGAADCSHAVPVTARRTMHRSPGAEAAASRAMSLAQVDVDDLAVVDLYSCFPSAVQVFANAVGIGIDPAPTVTGGMTFGGGPFNNYVLQASATAARRLRGEPRGAGLTSAVSGFLAKQGFTVWRTEPAPEGFRTADVTAEVAAVDPPTPLDAEYTGPVTVVTSTVEYAGASPVRGLLVCDTPAGARTLAVTDDLDVLRSLLQSEWAGRTVRVGAGGALDPGD